MFHRPWIKLLRLCEAEAIVPSPGERTRDLRGTVLVLLGLALLPLPLSGAFRYETGAPMPWCLALATLSSGLLGALWWPIRRRSAAPDQVWLTGGLWLSVVSGVALWVLYQACVHGFPTGGAVDSVGHLMEMQALAGPEPTTYFGMVAFQATAHWLQALGLDPFRAFRAVVYGLVFAVLGYATLVQGVLAADLQRTRGTTGVLWQVAGLSLVFGAYPLVRYLLPMLHGYQLDGYFPQLAGLVPLAATAVLYAVSRFRAQRLLVMALGVALMRYTYFLSIIDLIVTAALMVAWEALTDESELTRRRVLAGLAALGLVLGAYLYTKLHAVADNGGSIPAPDMTLRILGTMGLSLLLLAWPVVTRRLLLLRTDASVDRLAVFVGLYGLVTSMVQTTWLVKVASRGHTADDLYLLHKYGFAASVLVVCTAIPYVAYAATVALSSARRPVLLRRAATAVVASVFYATAVVSLVASIPALYVDTFQSLRRGCPGPLTALGDPDAWTRIGEILKEPNRQFGVFLAPLTTETMFTGYALRPIDSQASMPTLDAQSGLPPSLDYQALGSQGPDDCVFWLDPVLFAHIGPHEGRDFERRKVVEHLHRGPKTCEPYQRASHPRAVVQLCYFCGPSSADSLSGDDG